MSCHRHPQPPKGRKGRRHRAHPTMPNSQDFPLPGLLEWVLAGRTLEDLQELTLHLLPEQAQAHWQRWHETQEISELETLLPQLSAGDQHLLEILVTLEQGIELLQSRTQEALEHTPNSPLYFSEPEIRQLRWLLGLSESTLRRLQSSCSLQPFPLELRLGRRLIRYLRQILRDHPRRESLN